ncbi:MAG TPA: bifunctional diaminohydroxyphosphoribosylaminopyrimidine deaminase/5-amino-6-(5-phosphoribosylamino)uracil reductase RibD [Gammaproteobacteria bacterium]|nr:bifunctional diaminohydroxyphosphoribosylaminopyrimidine deaminase/5-amino-6-(5-phosphoribosylamino)uracil reductase RibD [Gammaproteobacteria bacterium]
MARAFELARRGLYGADPNPAVGCVLAHGGEVVGEGWHARAGEPHAEVHALAAAGARARGATAYVTLEPCNHQGRTPPCAAALIEAGVQRAVVALRDPHPRVDGAGCAALRAAGIEVEEGVLAGEAEALNRGFLSRHRRGRPFVVSKLAVSMDGRTALADGTSRWITGPAAREDGHRLRARSSAILTGIGTVLADDPSLTVRLPDPGGGWRQPRRVVLDSAGRLPASARVLAVSGETLVFVAEGSTPARPGPSGAAVERVAAVGGGLDLRAVLARLAALEVNELLVEAGPRLNGSLLAAGLVDEWIVYLAPVVLGDEARGMFALPALEHMRERIELENVEVRKVGGDWRFTLRPGREARSCSPAS